MVNVTQSSKLGIWESTETHLSLPMSNQTTLPTGCTSQILLRFAPPQSAFLLPKCRASSPLAWTITRAPWLSTCFASDLALVLTSFVTLGHLPFLSPLTNTKCKAQPATLCLINGSWMLRGTVLLPLVCCLIMFTFTLHTEADKMESWLYHAPAARSCC